MNNVKRPLRIPQDLRDTVTALHIDLKELMQCYIDSFRFYPFFSTRSEQEKLGILSKIRHGFVEFQRGGNIYFDPVLMEINQRYGQLLIKLSNNKLLSPKAHDHQSIVLIEKWEKEVRPLINYPEEVILKGGGRLFLSFNFALTNLVNGYNFRRLCYMYMQRISLAFLHAYDYPGNHFNNDRVKGFFNELKSISNALMPKTATQAIIIDAYQHKLDNLSIEMEPIKNYRKRMKVFRPLIKEWAEKMEEINKKETALLVSCSVDNIVER